MRKAVNFLEQNKIKRLAEGGMSAEDISFAMRVELNVVEAFMPKKPKKRRAPKKQDAPLQTETTEAKDDILAGMGEEILDES